MDKPKFTKPYPTFPLTANGNGQFSKKIGGKVRYFGSIANGWQAALARYEAEVSGKALPADCLQLRDILNAFHKAKTAAVERGELTARTFSEYESVCDCIADTIGKSRPIESLTNQDFERLREKLIRSKSGSILAATSQRRLIGYAKVVFRFANEDMNCNLRYAKSLAPPKAKQLRKAKHESGARLFDPADVWKLTAAAKPQMRAMIWLGVNCGFGNRDCGTLRVETLKDDWVNHPRPKTEVARRCPLLPETQAALQAVIGERINGLVFVTKYGRPWYGDEKGRDPIGSEFRKVAKSVGVDGSFYDLRRTFATVGQRAKDPIALSHIMGHVDATMAGVYRQLIHDEQLQAVVAVVAEWLNSGRPKNA